MIITKLQIRFNDMDPMQRVNNATYSSYLELARLDFCNKYLTIKELSDIPFVLVRVEMDIVKSLLPMRKAEVHTYVSKIGTSSWEFSYTILDSDSQDVYVLAKTTQVYFDYRQQSKQNIPESFRKILVSEMKNP